MSDSQLDRLPVSGGWHENEEQAWRLWAASARRALLSVKHKRLTAAEIYWRSAFDIALAHLEQKGGNRFSPRHVLEPLQGLVSLLIEQGKWMAARSLFNEVADLLSRKGFALDTLAERLLNTTAHRVVQAQKDCASISTDNVEEIPLPAIARGRRTGSADRYRPVATTGSSG